MAVRTRSRAKRSQKEGGVVDEHGREDSGGEQGGEDGEEQERQSGEGTTPVTSYSQIPISDKLQDDLARNPRTMTFLSILVIGLFTHAMCRNTEVEGSDGSKTNILAGIGACSFAYMVFSALFMPDGSMSRPHPAFWRFILGAGIVYFVILVFLLYNSVHDIRKLLGMIDPNLGKRLIFADYAKDCRFFTPENPESYFYNFRQKLYDDFALAHLIGWWGKTLVFRDPVVLWTTSFLFEMWELTFSNVLMNFRECWWDTLILDVFGCNLLGIILGLQTIWFLRMQNFDWSSRKEEGKEKSVLAYVAGAFRVFFPRKLESYSLRILSSRRRIFTLATLLLFQGMSECNIFFMKHILWLPSRHPLVFARLFLVWFLAMSCTSDLFYFVNRPHVKKVAPSVWVFCGVTLLETSLCLKLGLKEEEFAGNLSFSGILVSWIIGSFLLAVSIMYKYAYQ